MVSNRATIFQMSIKMYYQVTLKKIRFGTQVNL